MPGRAGTAGRGSGPSTARFSCRARPDTIKRTVLQAGPLGTAHLAIYSCMHGRQIVRGGWTAGGWVSHAGRFFLQAWRGGASPGGFLPELASGIKGTTAALQ